LHQYLHLYIRLQAFLIINRLRKEKFFFKKWFAGEIDNETLEMMSKPRCGVPDRVRPGFSNTRQKRFAIQGRDK
jgi:hypothetical protein